MNDEASAGVVLFQQPATAGNQGVKSLTQQCYNGFGSKSQTVHCKLTEDKCPRLLILQGNVTITMKNKRIVELSGSFSDILI